MVDQCQGGSSTAQGAPEIIANRFDDPPGGVHDDALPDRENPRTFIRKKRLDVTDACR